MTTPPTDAPERDPEQLARRIRLAIIGGVVLLVAVFAYFILQAMNEEKSRERWDVFAELRTKHEPSTDPLWRNPFGVYNPERVQYIAALEKFLEMRAAEDDDALAPQTRYMLAKTIADHILSNPGILDQAERGEFYKKAVAHLEAIRDKYPDFPLNWSTLSEEGFPSLTRQFINWLQENQGWESAQMMKPAEPAKDVRVLIRTERGDLLMGLYTDGAPTWTKAFLDRAAAGFYDGTYFSKKTEIGDASNPEVHSLLAGGSSTRELKPFDTASALVAAEAKTRSAILPAETRNQIPQERGIVSAWHPEEDTYDNETRFVVVKRRSPRMDYDYTPVGKLLAESGIDSLLTLDRLFGGEVWQKDGDVREDSDLRPILDYLQVPVKIVKVLVYENGALKAPQGEALATKAPVESTEKSLSSIQADRYQQEPPVKPGSDEAGN
jgi:cyclophilin family peptidyl-prolyl cis-trans isomerase